MAGLAVSLAVSISTSAALADDAAASQVVRQPVPRHLKKSPLDRRVNLLTKAFGLDAKQQAQLRSVLENEREQVRRVWDDPALPAPRRIAATQAIGDQTADRIRDLLNDEQKKKYKPPKPRDAGEKPDVEHWLKLIDSQQQGKADPHVDHP